jgi:hypothetical protein
LKQLEWQLKHLKDPVEDAQKAIETLGKTMSEYKKNMVAYSTGIKNILGEENFTAYMTGDASFLDGINLTDNQISTLEQYRDSLYDTADAADEFYSQIMEKVNSAFEGYNEEMEEHIEEADRYKAVVETYLNVIDLVGKKTLGVSNETVKALRRAQYEATKTSVAGLKE